jgi:hypothetical protein
MWIPIHIMRGAFGYDPFSRNLEPEHSCGPFSASQLESPVLQAAARSAKFAAINSQGSVNRITDESDWPNFTGSQKKPDHHSALLRMGGAVGAAPPIHLSTLYLPPQNAGSALIHSSFT